MPTGCGRRKVILDTQHIKQSGVFVAYVTTATAFRLLLTFSILRHPLYKATNRGSNIALDEAEREAAMATVIQDVYVVFTVGPLEGKLRTINTFLDCWGLKVTPYTPEVVYALGAARKWRKYRSVSTYICFSRTTARRLGAHISVAANRAVTDVIRSVKRGLGRSKHCEGLILEIIQHCFQLMQFRPKADHGGQQPLYVGLLVDAPGH